MRQVLAPREPAPGEPKPHETRNQAFDPDGRCGGCMFRACCSDASFGWWADSDVQPEQSEMPKALILTGENLFGLAICLVQRQPYFFPPEPSI